MKETTPETPQVTVPRSYSKSHHTIKIDVPPALPPDYDLVCFSHLRWDWVFQRPQHLLTRASKGREVFFVEEPLWEDAAVTPSLRVLARAERVTTVQPIMRRPARAEETHPILAQLIGDFIEREVSGNFIAWYYTPMALAFSEELRPSLTVYDCMDELSAFRGAPPELVQYERRLLDKADAVFTGGRSLYEAKRHLHANIHPFPSSIDFNHFSRARSRLPDPADQAGIPHPRAGFFGVIDERFDINLLDTAAELRPHVHFVMLGPVCKIDPSSLPQRANIHYLGAKSYEELPGYLANWDVALLPFALNDATRFISPTKTPEYLAGGIPVVSTPITDVVKPYGEKKLVTIARGPEEFARAIDSAREQQSDASWLAAVDRELAQTSWDLTWSRIENVLARALPRPTI